MLCVRPVFRCLSTAVVLTLMISAAHGQDVANVVNDLQRRLNECEKKNQGLETALAQLRQTNADQAKQAKDLQSNIVALQLENRQAAADLKQTQGQLTSMTAARKEGEAVSQSRLVHFNTVTQEKLAIEKERDDCQITLTGLREVHGKVAKAKKDLIAETATLRNTVKDLEASHAEVVKQSADRQNQWNACHRQLEKARRNLSNNKTQIATLKPVFPDTRDATEKPTTTKGQPEAPPEPQDDIIIDAEEIRVPDSGGANSSSRSGLVPEPFCTIDSAKTMQESSSGGGPRCCEKIAEQDQSRQTGSTRDNRPDAAQDSRSNSSGTFGTMTAVFADAAHFATGNCETGGSCSGQSPVMIYEGTSVRLTGDGCYEVRGIVEGPRVPAILCLQMTFFTRDSKLTTVTLPPIRPLPEIITSQLANETQVWFIRRTGYSDVLKNWPGPEHSLTVTRIGTAQIGQIPDA